MGNASNSKFAISRLKQSDKDTINTSELVRFPVMYGGNFTIVPEVDTYGDLVENQFESSKTDILGAIVNGEVSLAGNADYLGLALSSMLGTITSSNVATGLTVTAVAGTDVCTTASAHGYEIGQKVKFSTTTTLPAGLSASTVYYAGTLTSTTFKVYTSFSDATTETSAIDITDTGTGTHTATPEVYKHTITPSSTSTANFHTILFDDGTTQRRMVGAVPIELGFGADYQNKRMNVGTSFTAIRREHNDDTLTDTFTATTADVCTTASNHTFSNGHAVQFTTTGTLPAGLSTSTTYWVGATTDDTFKVYTSFSGAAGEDTDDLVDITDTGTGTHTVTALDVSFPTQERILPFHFTNGGADLAVTIDGTTTDHTDAWAGFGYSLVNAIAAEPRAGSNTLRIIERVEREQGLQIMLDYSDSEFCDLIQDYQTESQPKKIKVVMTLRGRKIGQSDYFKITGTFYHCQLANHGYSTDPNIGKQSLAFTVIHDTAEGKSVQWEIWNDTDSYLT